MMHAVILAASNQCVAQHVENNGEMTGRLACGRLNTPQRRFRRGNLPTKSDNRVVQAFLNSFPMPGHSAPRFQRELPETSSRVRAAPGPMYSSKESAARGPTYSPKELAAQEPKYSPKESAAQEPTYSRL